MSAHRWEVGDVGLTQGGFRYRVLAVDSKSRINGEAFPIVCDIAEDWHEGVIVTQHNADGEAIGGAKTYCLVKPNKTAVKGG